MLINPITNLIKLSVNIFNQFLTDTNGGRKRVTIKVDQQDGIKSTRWRLGRKKSAVEIENQQHTTLENLAPFTNYSIMISAETEEGEGPYSPPLFCSTQSLGKPHFFFNYFLITCI